MKRLALSLFALTLLFSVTARAAEVGQPAPAFTATTSKGQSVTLDSLKGKIVVLEWSNNGCPFVHKHYDSGNMQALQKEETSKGVVWAQVLSSAPDKQGAVTGAEADKLNADRGAAPTYVFLDPQGTLGRAYGAGTTPTMAVIDAKGMLAYEGAIDDKPSIDKADIATAHNYVRAAIDDLTAGRPVAVSRVKSYGCSIKYGS